MPIHPMTMLRWQSVGAACFGLAVAANATAQRQQPTGITGAKTQIRIVPGVIGLTIDSAQRILRPLNLLMQVNRRPDGSIALRTDTIVQQQPGPEQPFPPNRIVILTVRPPAPATNATGGDNIAAQSLVPNVTGLSLDSAQRVLRPRKLSMRIQSTPQGIATVGQDVITTQSPTARQAIPNDRTIAVEVAIAAIPVPNVGGMTLPNAISRLGRFRVESRLVRNAATPNTVFQQNPPPLTLARLGSTVTVYIAQATQPSPRRVPKVVGTQLQNANAILSKYGFEQGTISEDDDSTVAPGIVVQQQPQPGQLAAPGTRVALVVRSNRVRVPSLLTLSEAEATQQIEATGLRVGGVEKREDTATVGSVIGQSLAARTLVDRGTPLAIVIAEPVRLAMPNLVGLPRSRATAVVAQRGLVVDLIDTSSTLEGLDTVVAQNPRAQTAIAAGGRVRLTVGKQRIIAVVTPPPSPPPPTVVVPNIRGRTREQARVITDAAQFLLVLMPGQAPRDVDTIVNQFPAPLSRVPANASHVVMAEFHVTPLPPPPPPPKPWWLWVALGVSLVGMAIVAKLVAGKIWRPHIAPPPITYTAGAKPPTFTIDTRRLTHGLELSLSVQNDPGVQSVVRPRARTP